MELQRRQPTYARVEWASATLRATHGREPTEAEIVGMFLGVSPHLVNGIIQNLHESDACNRTAAACIGDFFEGQLRATEIVARRRRRRRKKGPAPGSTDRLTRQAQRLAVENLHIDWLR